MSDLKAEADAEFEAQLDAYLAALEARLTAELGTEKAIDRLDERESEDYDEHQAPEANAVLLSKEDDKGVWRTVNGTPVYIEGGKITRGPKELMGKSPDDASDKHDPADDWADESDFETEGEPKHRPKEFKKAKAWRMSLSKEEADMVHVYKAGLDGGKLSRSARNGKITRDGKILDSALRRSTVDDGLKVWRGGPLSAKEFSKLRKGSIITDRGFMSVTPDENIAEAFLDYAQDVPGHQAVMFELTTKNAKGAYVSLEKTSEPEYLLATGAKIKVTSVRGSRVTGVISHE